MTRALVLLCVLGVGVAACDESATADDRSDAERIVGAWSASAANVRVRSGIRVPVADLSQADDVQVFSFDTDGRFTFTFIPQDGRVLSVTALGQTVSVPVDQKVQLAGTFALDETVRVVTFSTVPNQTADDFDLGYRFNGAALELSAEDAETLGKLFGLADANLSQLSAVVTGGSVTYQSAATY